TPSRRRAGGRCARRKSSGCWCRESWTNYGGCSMSELERSIEQWRRTLAGSPGLTPDAVAELESHLRDEVQRLQESGLEPQRAVALAIEKLGTPQALAREFTKVAPEPVAPWWPMRVVCGATALLALLLVALLMARCFDGRMAALLAVHVGA